MARWPRPVPEDVLPKQTDRSWRQLRHRPLQLPVQDPGDSKTGPSGPRHRGPLPLQARKAQLTDVAARLCGAESSLPLPGNCRQRDPKLPARSNSAASASSRTKVRFGVGRWRLLQRQPAQPAVAQRPSWRQARGPRHRRSRSVETCLHTRRRRASSRSASMPRRSDRRTNCFLVHSLLAPVTNRRIAECSLVTKVQLRVLLESNLDRPCSLFRVTKLASLRGAKRKMRTPRSCQTLPASCPGGEPACPGNCRSGASKTRLTWSSRHPAPAP